MRARPVLPHNNSSAIRRSRRDAWLEANGPCSICGSRQRLEVDHIDPTTKANHKVSQNMWNGCLKRLAHELLKCQVLCHDCHFKKSQTERRDFNEYQARRFRNLYQHGVKISNLARVYGITHTGMSNIVKYKRYREVL